MTWYPLPRSRWTPPAIAGLVLALLVVRWYPDPASDETLTLTIAWQVSQGLGLYRDVFEFHPPGTFYFFGALFRVFGPSYLAAKIAIVLLTAATGFALDVLVRRFTSRGLPRVTVLAGWLLLVWQFPAIGYHSLAHLASIWVALFLVLASVERRTGWALACGLATAAAGWYMQPYGVVLAAVGVGSMLATRQLRLAFAYVAALAIALLPLLAWPLPLLWQHLVRFPLTYYAPANLSQGSPAGLFVLVAVVLMVGAAAVFSRRVPSGFWPLWFMSLVLPLTVWPHSQVGYLASVAWPLLLLLVVTPPGGGAMREQISAIVGQSLRFVAVVGGIAAAVVSVGFFSVRWPLHDEFGLRVPFWDDLGTAVQARTRTNEPIFAVPYLPAIYFFAQRPNATRHNSLQTAFHPPYVLDEIITDLERTKPRVVIREYASWLARLGQYDEGNRVDAYLDMHYRFSEELTQFAPRRIQLWERRVP
ncbi:MAG: hypothetical protein G01um101431_816 [Parcubacteria group bacterium Gr01-1014_31]|nr:MAG: hypothetical protein G01um101431_816 [Parcubacteria group bacterium Gr01-1014_31]